LAFRKKVTDNKEIKMVLKNKFCKILGLANKFIDQEFPSELKKEQIFVDINNRII